MKLSDFLAVDMQGVDKRDLHKSMILDNINRGKLFTGLVALINTVFATIVIVAYRFKVDGEFHYKTYFSAYASMVIVNVVFYLYLQSLSANREWSEKRMKMFDICLLSYNTFLLTWGSYITLIGQKRYGQIMVFAINMVVSSAVYYLRPRQIILPYSVSSALILLGLPLYQKSGDILIGHYINLPVIICAGIVISRMTYKSYCLAYKSRVQLERVIKKNEKINEELGRANQQLRKLSVVDGLTGLSNRRGFQNFIYRAFEDYVNGETSFAVIMMDIDYFKIYNDTYGHVAGDRVMRSVANQINSMLKNPMHYAARWGGEEFIYIAFHADEQEITKIAEEIRAGIQSLGIAHEYAVHHKTLTVSVGICVRKIRDKDEIEECVELADKALYEAKHAGRNQVKICMGEPKQETN